jgi:hypothetical protein
MPLFPFADKVGSMATHLRLRPGIRFEIRSWRPVALRISFEHCTIGADLSEQFEITPGFATRDGGYLQPSAAKISDAAVSARSNIEPPR